MCVQIQGFAVVVDPQIQPIIEAVDVAAWKVLGRRKAEGFVSQPKLVVRQPIHVLLHERIVGLHRDIFAVHRPKRLGVRQRVAEHDDGVEVAVQATHGGVAQQRVVVFGHVHGVGMRP